VRSFLAVAVIAFLAGLEWAAGRRRSSWHSTGIEGPRSPC
jgi:hypothetical protein